MKTLTILFLAIILLFHSLQGVVIHEIEANISAPVVIMDDTHFCIWDKKAYRIFMYSIVPFRKVGEFGRKGEGPGDINSQFGTITLYGNDVYISQYPRLSVFSKSGRFRKVMKCSEAGSFFPLGQNFVGTQYGNKPGDISEQQYFLFDSQLKKKKEIFRTESKAFAWRVKNRFHLRYVRSCSKAVVYNDRLFIGNPYQGFIFPVFDAKGNKLYEIRRDYEKRKVTVEYKDWSVAKVKKAFGKQWPPYMARAKIIFPEYFPAYINFTVADGKLYVFLHPVNDRGQEVHCFDLSGKLLKKATITLNGYSVDEKSKISIKDNRLYYMVDNPETEKWEIHAEELWK